jgi:hypothetical protein
VADWNQQKGQVIKVCSMLLDTSKKMAKNAQEQDVASH